MLSKNTSGSSLKREAILGGLFLATIAIVLVLGSNWASIKPIFDDHPSASEQASSSAEATRNMAANAAAASSSALRAPTSTPPPTTSTRPSVSSNGIDGAFVQTLDDFDIGYSSASQAVSTAKTTCRTIDNSSDPANAILAASAIAQRSGGYTSTEANDFVGVAVAAYCPEYNAYVFN